MLYSANPTGKLRAFNQFVHNTHHCHLQEPISVMAQGLCFISNFIDELVTITDVPLKALVLNHQSLVGLY